MEVSKIVLNFAPQLRNKPIVTPNNDSLAQLVEQLTLNQRVESSSLSGVTKKHRLRQNNDSLAQLVEQLTLNQRVESSSLSGVTRQKVRNLKAPKSVDSGAFFVLAKSGTPRAIPARASFFSHPGPRISLWRGVFKPTGRV